MAPANEPKLLYAISGVKAYHITNGKSQPLTPAGPQTLSLLMVPTSSAFAEAPTKDAHGSSPEEDFYLHLHLPPELDLPLPATTQIYHQPPTSYLIPRWDMGPDSGAFTRIEFPAAGSRPGLQEDVDTFETILAQCTAFLERAPPPSTGIDKGDKAGASTATSAKAREAAEDTLPPYHPGDYAPGEAYARGSHSSPTGPTGPTGGQLVLVDEEDGSVIGELGDGFQVVEDGKLTHGSKDPVEITLPSEGSHQINVAPASEDFLEMASLHPAYQKSKLVSNAAAASRLIVTGSAMMSRILQGQAESYTQKTQPTSKPVTFKPATHAHIRRINTLTGGAKELSTKTVGKIGVVAQHLGATLAGRKDPKSRGFGPDGKPLDTYKPGLLNKSLMAFNTVVDGVEHAGRTLLTSTSNAATTVVAHKWGPEAGEVAANMSGGVKNVALVYIDVTGVSRRAILRSVGKGMVVGTTASGQNIIVGGGDGGELPERTDTGSPASSSYVNVAEGKRPANGKR